MSTGGARARPRLSRFELITRSPPPPPPQVSVEAFDLYTFGSTVDRGSCRAAGSWQGEF